MLHACLGEESTYQHIYICHLRPYFWLIRACFRQQRPQVHSFCNYIRFPVNLTNLEKKPEQKGKVFFRRLHVKHDFTLSRSVLTDGTKKKKPNPLWVCGTERGTSGGWPPSRPSPAASRWWGGWPAAGRTAHSHTRRPHAASCIRIISASLKVDAKVNNHQTVKMQTHDMRAEAVTHMFA